MPGLDHFKWIAPWYDRIISYAEDDDFLNWVGLPISGNLIDIGGGTGRVATSMVGKVNKLVIVDVSFDMVMQARKKGFSLTCGKGEFLPFQEETFERAMIVDALHHCNDQKGVIRDVWRILKPGGLLVIVEPNYEHPTGKLIRVFEKLLVMRSKFLSDFGINSLVSEFSEDISIKHVKGNSWFKVEKKSSHRN